LQLQGCVGCNCFFLELLLLYEWIIWKKNYPWQKSKCRSIIQACVAFSGFKMLHMYRCIYTSRQAPRDASSSEKENIERRERKLTIQFLFFTFFVLLVLYIPQGNISRSWRGWNYILTASYILSPTRTKSFSLCWHNSGICNLRGLHKLFVQEIVR
jgi:hypothetical protein